VAKSGKLKALTKVETVAKTVRKLISTRSRASSKVTSQCRVNSVQP
jgi:hypothetical protein